MKSPMFLFVVILATVLTTLSQTRSLTKEQFGSTITQANEKAEKFARRVVTVIRHYADKKLESTNTTTWEFLPPDKSRLLDEQSKNGAVTSTETITLGDVKYERTGQNAWKKIDPASIKEMRLDRLTKLADVTDCWEFLALNSTVDGRPATLFFIPC